MPTLIATPNPTKPAQFDVTGSGFSVGFVSLVFRGNGTTTMIRATMTYPST